MDDEFDINNVKTVDFEDLFNGKYERKNKPFVYFIDYKIFKGKNIFGYSPFHVIFQPHKFLYNRLENVFDEIRWAYQRVYRGWDDRASWSTDTWLTENAIEILKVLRKNKMGVPDSMFEGLPYEDEERCTYSDDSYNLAEERWNAEIDKMISGFEAANKIHNSEWKTVEDYKELESIFREGMKPFVEHYFNLWD